MFERLVAQLWLDRIYRNCWLSSVVLSFDISLTISCIKKIANISKEERNMQSQIPSTWAHKSMSKL